MARRAWEPLFEEARRWRETWLLTSGQGGRPGPARGKTVPEDCCIKQVKQRCCSCSCWTRKWMIRMIRRRCRNRSRNRRRKTTHFSFAGDLSSAELLEPFHLLRWSATTRQRRTHTLVSLGTPLHWGPRGGASVDHHDSATAVMIFNPSFCLFVCFSRQVMICSTLIGVLWTCESMCSKSLERSRSTCASHIAS